MAQSQHDDELTRKAYKEIMAETKRAAEVADKVGVEGWRKRGLKPNKRFLQSTLMGSLKSNRRAKGTERRKGSGENSHEMNKRTKYDSPSSSQPKATNSSGQKTKASRIPTTKTKLKT